MTTQELSVPKKSRVADVLLIITAVIFAPMTLLLLAVFALHQKLEFGYLKRRRFKRLKSGERHTKTFVSDNIMIKIEDYYGDPAYQIKVSVDYPNDPVGVFLHEAEMGLSDKIGRERLDGVFERRGNRLLKADKLYVESVRVQNRFLRAHIDDLMSKKVYNI